MKIKKGQHMCLAILIGINIMIIMLGIFGFLLGFEKTLYNTLVFTSIIFGTMLFSILIYYLVFLLNRSYYIIEKDRIVFFNKNIKKLEIKIEDITNAIYFCFNWRTILNQSIFGFMTIKSKNSKEIYIDMSKKTAKKINDNYFLIEFRK